MAYNPPLQASQYLQEVSQVQFFSRSYQDLAVAHSLPLNGNRKLTSDLTQGLRLPCLNGSSRQDQIRVDNKLRYQKLIFFNTFFVVVNMVACETARAQACR